MRFSFVLCLLLSSCATPQPTTPRPSILLITMDTTRADYMGYAGGPAATPTLDALAAKARVFDHAYAPAPMTLPSHTSMMTGLYPAGHGVHENGRYLHPSLPLLAPRLQAAGYRTAAVVSAFPLDGDFGLKRGFHSYDDHFPSGAQRKASTSTDSALEALAGAGDEPLFLWVHYFDPHHPYAAPEPYASAHGNNAYAAEIAYMDAELGRLTAAFQQRFAEYAMVVVGDHGEGLGEHGESFHGRLAFDGTMRVPLLVAGNKVTPQKISTPVSVRRVYHTIAALAAIEDSPNLMQDLEEVVLAEAMKPYLQYGWQPQVMGVFGDRKVIETGKHQIFALTDTNESRDLADSERPSRELLAALRGYPLPGQPYASEALDEEARANLQSLGYASSAGIPRISGDRLEPAAMTQLFQLLDRGSDLFVARDFKAAVSIYDQVLAQDPNNLMVHMRQAVSLGFLKKEKEALEHFQQARRLAPDSADVRHYLGMFHYDKGRFEEAALHFEAVLQQQPRKLPALVKLGLIRASQGRIEQARDLLGRALSIKPDQGQLQLRLAQLCMASRQSEQALVAFQQASALLGNDFYMHLEMGVCFLDVGRLEEAATCLDRVDPTSDAYPMSRFKRAQVAALLEDSNLSEYIEAARTVADPALLKLIHNERLFQRR